MKPALGEGERSEKERKREREEGEGKEVGKERARERGWGGEGLRKEGSAAEPPAPNSHHPRPSLLRNVISGRGTTPESRAAPRGGFAERAEAEAAVACPFKGPVYGHRQPRRPDVPGPPRPVPGGATAPEQLRWRHLGAGDRAVVPAPPRLPGLLTPARRVRASRRRRVGAPAAGTHRGDPPRGGGGAGRGTPGGRAAPVGGRGRGARARPAVRRVGLGRRVPPPGSISGRALEAAGSPGGAASRAAHARPDPGSAAAPASAAEVSPEDVSRGRGRRERALG